MDVVSNIKSGSSGDKRMLDEIIRTNDEHMIQKYLEKHSEILVASIGTANWAYNYVLPQFRLGDDGVVDFVVMTGQSDSYWIHIVELKLPEDIQFNKDGSYRKALNKALSQVNVYQSWIEEHLIYFKELLSKRISEKDSDFNENFEFTRRFIIYADIIIGRRENLTAENRKITSSLYNNFTSIISYDRLIETEKRLNEMLRNNIPFTLYGLDGLIAEKYNGLVLDNKIPDNT